MLGSLFSADSTIDAYLLVYDITSRTSLENLEYFDELIEKNLDVGVRPAGTAPPVKIVAGNKCDLSENRVISSAEGLAWAKSHGCGFMETSAKVMVNIEETFETLIRQVSTGRRNALAEHQASLQQKHPGNRSANLRSALSSANLRPKEKTSPSTAPNAKKKRSCCVIS